MGGGRVVLGKRTSDQAIEKTIYIHNIDDYSNSTLVRTVFMICLCHRINSYLHST